MAHDHPFQHLFESLTRPPVAHAELVNRRAYEEMAALLAVPTESSGRCILLRANRAGHGKTHLLSRLRHFLGTSHEFIPLHAAAGCRIDAGTVLDDTLRGLLRQLPASGGMTVLDLVTRRLFASALQPLVGSGEVPCQDREGALAALRMRPVETFDFHHPNAVTAHWARENFEILGQRLSQELAQRCGLPMRGIAFWVDALFTFASSPLDHSGRVTTLVDQVNRGTEGEMERLEALLGLVGQLVRVVLVADDVEGFSSEEAAALRFAAFIATLREAVDRLDVILSINRDIWESAFLPRLSDGLADRLSEVVVELEPLKPVEMLALLESRTPGLGEQVLERIDLGTSGTHARGLIRAAGVVWMQATAQPAVLPEPPAPPLARAIPEPEPRPSILPPPAPQVTANPVMESAVVWPDPAFSPPPPPVAFEPAPYENPIAPAEPVVSAESWSSPAPSESVVSESGFLAADPLPPVETSSPNPILSPGSHDSGNAPEYSPQIPEAQAESPSFVPEEFPQQSHLHPVAESPFQLAEVNQDARVAADFQNNPPPAWTLVDATDGVTSSAIEATFHAVSPTPSNDGDPRNGSDSPLAPAEADTDRVDDLLRQFRERYGRGSL
ncbi:MAG: hypothetical protein V4640_06440 [Verrucomicrobiota bacterium]